MSLAATPAQSVHQRMSNDAKCAISCGTPFFGIPITIHVTFFVLLALNLINAITRTDSLAYTVLIILLYGPILLVTILVHEYGHALCNRYYGGDVAAQQIVLWPLGGYVTLGRTEGLTIMEDFWVALAGPLTHFPMAGIWFALFLLCGASTKDWRLFADYVKLSELKHTGVFFQTLFQETVFLNIVLFIFNVFVPAYPMDGGRILAALLVECGVKVNSAAKITATTALVIAALLGGYSLYELLLDGDPNGGAPLLLLLIAVWIVMNSVSLLAKAKTGRALEHPLFAKECYRRADAETPADRRARRNHERQQQHQQHQAQQQQVPPKAETPKTTTEMVAPHSNAPKPQTAAESVLPSWATLETNTTTTATTTTAAGGGGNVAVTSVPVPEPRSGNGSFLGRLFGNKDKKKPSPTPPADDLFV